MPDYSLPPIENAPPLPHLSGPPPTPGSVRRARLALVLSITTWITFIGSLILFGIISESKGRHQTLPIVRWRLENCAGLILFSSIIFSALGTLMGLVTRKETSGRVALVAGGISVLLWIFLIAAALYTAQHRRH